MSTIPFRRPPDGGGPSPPRGDRESLPFAQVPDALSEDPSLNPRSVQVANILASYARKGRNCCWPTNATIAGRANCSVSTVYRALLDLQRSGWIALEVCPSVSRGQIIRLLWTAAGRSPGQPSVTPVKFERGGGRSNVKGGSVTVDRGGRSEMTDRSRPSEADPEAEAPRLLTEEEVTLYQGVLDPRGGGDKIQKWIAAAFLSDHARALELAAAAQKSTPAAGDLFGERPAAGGKGVAVPVALHPTTETVHPSRRESVTEHNAHYKDSLEDLSILTLPNGEARAVGQGGESA